MTTMSKRTMTKQREPQQTVAAAEAVPTLRPSAISAWRGRFATLLDVLNHYDTQFNLKLSDTDKKDLIEYLKGI
jgi:hypothetical protein